MADDDEIGYRNPPRNSRFVKGRSGNPKGRPPGTRNTGTILHEVMSQKVQVTEHGRTRVITKVEAILLQVFNKAAGGDLKAAREALQLVRVYENSSSDEEASDSPDAEKDDLTLQRLLLRMQSRHEK